MEFVEVQGKTFKSPRIDSLPETDHAYRFIDCTVTGGSIGAKARRPAERLVVRNISAVNCMLDWVIVGPVVFDQVEFDGLRMTKILWLPGCAFNQCILRGKIEKILHFENADPVAPRSDSHNHQFIEDNDRIHREATWTLDISEAEFDDFDLRGVPGETVRINSHNQVCVDYKKALQAQESGAFAELQGFPKLVMENGIKRRKDSKYNFVLQTNPGSEYYRDMQQLFELLTVNGLCLT